MIDGYFSIACWAYCVYITPDSWKSIASRFITLDDKANDHLLFEAKIMKIIQPSPRKLILKKDGNSQETVYAIAKLTGIGFIVSLLFSVKQGFGSTSSIIIFPIFCFMWLAFMHNYTATFDLDLQSIEINTYLILFKKQYSKKYDFTSIRRVVVEKNHQFIGYNIILKQFNGGNDIYLPSPDSTSILFAE
jgi:hypothetical protein